MNTLIIKDAEQYISPQIEILEIAIESVLAVSNVPDGGGFGDIFE